MPVALSLTLCLFCFGTILESWFGRYLSFLSSSPTLFYTLTLSPRHAIKRRQVFSAPHSSFFWFIHCIIRSVQDEHDCNFLLPTRGSSLLGGIIDLPSIGSSSIFGKFLSTRFPIPNYHKLHFNPIHASISHHHHASFVVDPISTHDSSTETESTLILIRHGESLFNEKNLFTGCCDVPLTKRGVEEAIEAGKRISYIPVDIIFTSGLIRAQMTAMLAMTQHRRKKVPIIIHDESEQAMTWTRVYSETTTKQSIPVITAWQLNERMYGELQGLNKKETAERYGKEKVYEWRRSYDIPPPKGESLEMCSQRAVAYFKEFVEPQLKSGKHVMVAAHGNSLRSIIMYLDKLTSQEVTDLELSTGIPLLYIYKEGKFSSRGSPVGPTEAGVYAYTQSLAVYRQQLDEMSH